MYMEIPKGCKVNAKGDYILQILWNIYSQKQASSVWFLHLVKKLKSIGFIQLTTSPCIFVRKDCIYILYTNDSILTGPQCTELLKVVEDMKVVELKITIEGIIANFLGVNIKRDRQGNIHLTQPQLIDSIFKELNLDRDKVKGKLTPATMSKLLHSHADAPQHDGHFHYPHVIGKLNYLEKCTRPDIAFATHQCA